MRERFPRGLEIPDTVFIYSIATMRPNERPDGTVIVESNCMTCRHFAYQGRICGALQPSAGCGLHLTGFPDTKDCLHYEREAGSDDDA